MGRVTPGTLIALIALVLALGGTSLATTAGKKKLPKNSVGTKQLKPNAVTGDKVADGSLQGADFAPGQLPQGAQGPQGPQGVQGLQGVQGPVGPSEAFQNVAGNSNTAISNDCAAPTTLNTLVLAGPASYLVSGVGYMFNGSTTVGALMQARLVRDGTQLGLQAEIGLLPAVAGIPSVGVYDLNRVINITGASQTVTVRACRSFGTAAVQGFNFVLNATMLGSATGAQSPAETSAEAGALSD